MRYAGILDGVKVRGLYNGLTAVEVLIELFYSRDDPLTVSYDSAILALPPSDSCFCFAFLWLLLSSKVC